MGCGDFPLLLKKFALTDAVLAVYDLGRHDLFAETVTPFWSKYRSFSTRMISISAKLITIWSKIETISAKIKKNRNAEKILF